MSKTILANVDGFTPVIDDLIDEMGLMSSVVFGRIWRYCQMEDGVCNASLETIGDGIGVDKATVMRHAKELCDAGYLKDLTPELRNRPHVYADTGKAGLKVQISGVAQRKAKKDGVAQRNVTVAESNEGVAESQLNRVFNKDSNRERMPALDFKNMSVSEARKLPTIKLYIDATEQFPSSVLWETVHTTILQHGLTFEKLHAAAVAWIGRGYNPGNVDGILQWAVNGIPANGKNAAPLPPPANATNPFASLEEALARRGIQP